MALTIDFINEKNLVEEIHDGTLTNLLQHAAEKLHVGEAECSVSFVDNDTIQAINAQYRDKDQVTDVISFALEEEGEGEVVVQADGFPRVLGDIIVSIPKAQEQAVEHGHSFERELGFLVVHGFLHLLGYDHMIKEDEEKMFALQEEILTSFGLPRQS